MGLVIHEMCLELDNNVTCLHLPMEMYIIAAFAIPMYIILDCFWSQLQIPALVLIV